MATVLERIVAAGGYPEVIELLAERLSPTDLQSLILEFTVGASSARTPRPLRPPGFLFASISEVPGTLRRCCACRRQ
jgi:hypothetical protein